MERGCTEARSGPRPSPRGRRRGLGTAAIASAAAALLAAAATAASATDYYVANGGSDGASGLAPGSAWATLQHAADTIGPGDTVHVADGNYTGFDVRIVGTAAQPVVFVADGGAAAIVADNPVTPDGINVENAAYVTIDGFIVNNRTRTGVRAALSDHVTIRNCSLGQNGSWGILTGFVDDLVAEDNEAWGSVLEHGIYASNSGDRPVIRRNHIHDNHANGIHMNGDASLGGDGTISNALVEENVIHGNGTGGGSGINMDGVVGSVVRNNLLYDNHASGISLYRIDGATGSTGNLVVNNTVINASDARWCINIRDASTGNTLRNNILHNAHSFRGAIVVEADSLAGFTSDYNSLMDRMSADGDATILDLADWQALGYDTHSFVAVPTDHFVAPGSDFHLLPSSPAVDAGTAASAPPTDLDGNPRPVGAAPDLGAYEAQLLECGDGNVDVGEQCGEPGLGACADPCSACLGCTCAEPAPVCGDALVCGDEQCEDDGDCAMGQACSGCACVNAPACTSGIVLEAASQKIRATPFSLKLKAELLVPKPWAGVDPDSTGLRLVFDSTSLPGGLDVTLPGGAAWRTNAAGTTWIYTDKTGAAGGIVKAVVKDRSSVEDGRLRVQAKGKSTSTVAVPADGVRTAVLFGLADECGQLEWNGPSGPSPSCSEDSGTMTCR